jgi:transposase
MISTENQIEINVGVDVGKSKLDIVLHPMDLHFSIPNDQEHISEVIQVLKTHQFKRIVTETTWRYEQAFAFACNKAGLSKLAALVGVEPMNRESGSYSGKRRIRAGRHRIRTVMFMAMLSSIQCNSVFKQQYEHLKASGKLPKVALIACMRKMIVILNTMIKNEELWREKTA